MSPARRDPPVRDKTTPGVEPGVEADEGRILIAKQGAVADRESSAPRVRRYPQVITCITRNARYWATVLAMSVRSCPLLSTCDLRYFVG